MSEALTRAARAIKDALGEALNATPLIHTPSHSTAGDWTATASYSVDLDATARAAILAFLNGKDVVEACARAMTHEHWPGESAEFRATRLEVNTEKAQRAIAALRALVQEDGT